jgi:prepilin-type processing-associated H-X9-DG protein
MFAVLKDNKAGCVQGLANTFHASGLNIALADGSSRTPNPGVAQATWTALLTPRAGDTVGDY